MNFTKYTLLSSYVLKVSYALKDSDVEAPYILKDVDVIFCKYLFVILLLKCRQHHWTQLNVPESTRVERVK